MIRKCRRCTHVRTCHPYDTLLARRVWLCDECIAIVKSLVLRTLYHGA